MDTDHEDDNMPTSQIAIISLPPSSEREVMVKYPIHYTAQQCMAAAAVRFCHDQQHCILQSSMPTQAYFRPNHELRVPATIGHHSQKL